MFNLGISEMAAIAILALLLIGPKQLPEVARMVGRFLNDLKRSTNSFTEDLKSQVQIDRQKIFDLSEEERRRKEMAQFPPPGQARPAEPKPPATQPTTDQFSGHQPESKPDDKKS